MLHLVLLPVSQLQGSLPSGWGLLPPRMGRQERRRRGVRLLLMQKLRHILLKPWMLGMDALQEPPVLLLP